MTSDEQLLARFAELRASAERTVDGCLLWRATAPNRNGYAELRVGRSATARGYVHRLAWAESFGNVASAEGVFHHCDTPLCIEPSHLFSGPQSANLADMHAKGRGSTEGLQRRGNWDSCKRGHPLAGANLIHKKGGGRECRACRRARDRKNRALRLGRTFDMAIETLYPRDEQHRYRVYARRGKDELEVLCTTPTPGGIGEALVQLDEDEREHGRRLIDRGAIGVLDVMQRRWIVMPWHRPETTTRLREAEVIL